MSEELPEGWAFARLDELLEPGGLFDGPFGSSLKSSDYTDTGVRVIRLENLGNLRFVEDKETFVSETKYAALTKHTVVPGDILVGSFVDGAVRVCVLPRLRTKAIAKADCFTVRTHADAIERHFVAFQLGTNAVRDAFVGDIHGATRPRITTKQLRDCRLALAPLAEQRRIVTQVEALLEQVNRAKMRLGRVPLILKRFRQAVLAAACSGELTPELDSSTWDVRTLGDVLDGFESGRNLKCEGRSARAGELGVLKISAVTWRTFRPGENKALLPGDEPRPHERVRAGDLLITRANTAELVGAVALVDRDYPQLMLPDKILRLRLKTKLVEARYLLHALRSQGVRNHFEAEATGTSDSMRNLSQPKLAAAPIVVPPLSDQLVVAARIEALLTIADAIEHRVKAATTRADKLPQAILSKAFSGELVPTEAELARAEGRTYETAAELLVRVGARSKSHGKKASSRGRKRAGVEA